MFEKAVPVPRPNPDNKVRLFQRWRGKLNTALVTLWLHERMNFAVDHVPSDSVTMTLTCKRNHVKDTIAICYDGVWHVDVQDAGFKMHFGNEKQAMEFFIKLVARRLHEGPAPAGDGT